MSTKIELIELLQETQRLLRNGANGAIVDTVWSESGLDCTLYEKIEIAINDKYSGKQQSKKRG